MAISVPEIKSCCHNRNHHEFSNAVDFLFFPVQLKVTHLEPSEHLKLRLFCQLLVFLLVFLGDLYALVP